MATVSSRTIDVFISHASGDATLAREIANACRASGVEAVTNADLVPGPGVTWGDELWEALAESRALLAVLSPSGPTASMAIELGAARAWNKPIFAVVTDPSATHLPPAMSDVRLFTSSRIDEVINAVKRSAQQFTEQDREILADLYSVAGVSVDQLALDPRLLGELVGQYRKSTGKAVSGERLLSELLRLRKQAKLRRRRAHRRIEPT